MNFKAAIKLVHDSIFPNNFKVMFLKGKILPTCIPNTYKPYSVSISTYFIQDCTYIFWLRFSLKKIYWKIFALCDDKLFIVFNSEVWLSNLNIYDLVSSISWADDIQWNHILLISFTVRGTVDNSISFCIFIEDLWIFFFKMIRSEKKSRLWIRALMKL